MSLRDDALDLIERVNIIDPEAAAYLLGLFEQVPEGEEGIEGYNMANNLDSTFTWNLQPQGGDYWSSLYGQDIDIRRARIRRAEEEEDPDNG